MQLQVKRTEEKLEKLEQLPVLRDSINRNERKVERMERIVNSVQIRLATWAGGGAILGAIFTFLMGKLF